MPDSFSLAVRDMLVCCLWLFDNMLLVCASARIAARFLPADLGAAKVLNITTISCAILTAVLLLLGAANIFSGVSMLAGIFITSLTIIWWLKMRGEGHRGRPTSSTFTVFWMLLTGLLCGHCLVNGLLRLPTDHDCLMYHLPLVDSWLQAGSLYAPDASHWSSPAGSELLAAWCCGPFSGDFLSALNNLPSAIIWASATLQFCRLLGLTQRWPELATISALSVHALLRETDDASNDLMVVAFFMASNVYVIRFFQANDPALRTMIGICLGLLCGVKFFALGYAGVTWVAMIGGLALVTNWKISIRTGISTAALSLLFGGYWYIRNIVCTGLPLYPMGDTASLAYPNIWSTSLVGNDSPDLWPLFFEALWKICGPIHWFAATVLPVTVGSMIWKTCSDWRNKPEEWIQKRWVSVAVLLGSAAVLWVTPYLIEDQPGTLNHLRWGNTPTRYALCFLTMSVVCLFTLIHGFVERLPVVGRRLVFLAIAACLTYQLGIRIQSHAYEFSFMEAAIVGIDLGLFMLAVRWLLDSRAQRGMKIAACLTIALLLSIGTGILASRWHNEFDRHFDQHFRTTAFTKLNDGAFDGTRICVLDYRPYAFYGSRRQHHVINPRRFVSEDCLARTLRSRGIQIVTALGAQGYSVDRYRGAFELLTGDNETFPPLVESWPLTVAVYRSE